MDILEQYLQRSQEIIGNRTKDEERYDKEVYDGFAKERVSEKR